MAGPVTDSRLRNGALDFVIAGDTPVTQQFACQSKNVTISPPDKPSGDDAEEVLCGTVLPPDGGGDAAWKLKINTVQDFDNPEGVQKFLIDHQGELAQVTWTPNPNGLTVTGTVTVWPGDLGGDVKKRLESSLEMDFDSKPTFTWATTP